MSVFEVLNRYLKILYKVKQNTKQNLDFFKQY